MLSNTIIGECRTLQYLVIPEFQFGNGKYFARNLERFRGDLKFNIVDCRFIVEELAYNGTNQPKTNIWLQNCLPLEISHFIIISSIAQKCQRCGCIMFAYLMSKLISYSCIITT